MGDEVATSNVNRAYSLAATSVAIFTFTLFFLHPRFVSGEADSLLFQATIVVMGLATFSFVFATFYYYGASLGGRMIDKDRVHYARRGDRFWLLGYTLLLLAPTLILFSIELVAVGCVWLALWLVFLVFIIRRFPKVRTELESEGEGVP